MVTKLEQLKEWAKQNVTLIDLLPNNNGLQVTIRLIDVLEDKVDEKYYLSDEKVEKLTLDFSLTSQDKHGVAIREATKQGYALAEQGDSVNVSYPTSKTRRGRVGKQVAQTLQAGEVNQGVVMNDIRIRKLVPIETWRLQGFTDEQFYKAKDSGVSNSQLYKQAGNSVSVPVVDAIVKCL
ncbi:DNA cytosine methyltransferase [Staphylococcus saprophyticus]|nr:DNA cytosine methyltransferase [Staphylococcus saprophyticus]MDW4264061.1 DNA cytosine methyltransferase [Staphylococcus saprophyticus]